MLPYAGAEGEGVIDAGTAELLLEPAQVSNKLETDSGLGLTVVAQDKGQVVSSPQCEQSHVAGGHDCLDTP